MPGASGELTGLYWRRWIRSRGPLFWLAFIVVWAWYDMVAAPAGALAWWGNWTMLVPILGFLAGYDTYSAMRENGSLRLMLLQPVSRSAVSGAMFAAGSLVVWAALMAFLVYLIATGRVPSVGAGAATAAIVALGCLPFVAFAQLGSLLLPRDVIVVLGALLIVLGFGSFDRWLPDTAPQWLDATLNGLEHVLPATQRVSAVLAQQDGYLIYAIEIVGQVALGLVLIRLALGRRRLLARRDVG